MNLKEALEKATPRPWETDPGLSVHALGWTDYKLARHAINNFEPLLDALKAAAAHLEYCGYGDSWEREGGDAAGLPDQIDNAIRQAEEVR